MATTLNLVELADPFDVSVQRKLRGSGARAANGTWQIDYYSTTLMKDAVTVKWRLLTSTERNTIVTQVQNAIATARTLVLPDGESISVYFSPDSPLNETKVRTGSGIKYNLDVVFTEAT